MKHRPRFRSGTPTWACRIAIPEPNWNMASFGRSGEFAVIAPALLISAVLFLYGPEARSVAAHRGLGPTTVTPSAGVAPHLVGKWREVSDNGYPVSPGADICQYFADHRYHCTGYAVQKAPPGTWRYLGPTHIRLTAYGATFNCTYSITLTTLTTTCGGNQGVQKYRRVSVPSPSPTPTVTLAPMPTSTTGPIPTKTPTGKSTPTATATFVSSTPTPVPTSSPTSTTVSPPTPTPTPSHSSIVGTWIAKSIDGKPVSTNFQTCEFFASGNFSCTGHNATGSAQWAITGPSQLVLSSKGHSVECSFTVSVTTLSIDCGATGSDTYTRATTTHTGAFEQVVRSAAVPAAILGGTVILVALLVILGRTSPPSRKRA